MKNLLAIDCLSKREIKTLIERGIYLKKRKKEGIPYAPLIGKTLSLIFEKPSTRTRVSFEAAMHGLGGNTIFISHMDSQLSRGEPVKDTARVISRYTDAVLIRTFSHDIIEEFARYSTVPVINGLTDRHHPCQVLADIMTVREKKGDIKKLKVAWIGDGNNMANSWIEAASILGFELWLACPEGYAPHAEILKTSGDNITLTTSVESAARHADVLNTDVWTSMGQDAQREKRLEAFKGFQINSNVLGFAKKDAIVMHCLPAHRGEEITDAVIDGPNSIVFDQAENRLHVQKAILESLLA
ncbi:MAG: ornithine carbamoyltransferase [Deltaproteobacteria bacterium]|nr:ornithine carbamoyltransferase [Deltaproteobacteria bacterium]